MSQKISELVRERHRTSVAVFWTKCRRSSDLEGLGTKLNHSGAASTISNFSSVRQLHAAIDANLAEHNKDPKPFTWTASADSISENSKTPFLKCASLA